MGQVATCNIAHMVGETVGSFRVLQKIGEGGMGAVYLAEHPLIGKRVAIKMLLPELSQNPEIVNRFFNEARAATLLKHPGLIEVFDFGHHPSGSAFIVMEFLDGQSLASKLRQDQVLSLDLLLDLVRQIGIALSEAHKKNIVHRDLKPDNVFLVPDPERNFGVRAKVLDFGIAKLASDSPTSTKTRTGVMMGTPTYMSPEQCRGAGAVDHRTDVYALGCMVFEMATGRAPYVGQGPGDVLAAHIYEPIPSVRELAPQAPEALDHIVKRAMAKRVEDRYPSLAELIADVEALARQGGAVTFRSQPSSASPHPQTTLSSSAGQVGGGQGYKRSTGLAIGVAAAVLLGGGGLLAWKLSASSSSSTGPAPALVIKPEAPKPEAPKPEAPKPEAPAPKAAAAPTVEKTHLHIDSTPPNAEVYRTSDGIRVGTTPLDLDIGRTRGQAVFTVRLAGYKDERVSLDADHDGSDNVTLIAKSHHTTPPAVAKPVNIKPVEAKPEKPVETKPEKPVAKPVKNGVLDPFAN